MSRFHHLVPILVCLLSGCAERVDVPLHAPVVGEAGDPLPGLDPESSERFRLGAALFNKVFTPEEGLGPLFNENQCSACHTVPALGGTGDQFVTKATRFVDGRGCDLLAEKGGENVRGRATPLLMALGVQEEQVPIEATEVDRFLVPFLFGLGLAEAIPQETLAALADPEDLNGDGISGRLARTADGRVGLFGRKADFATLEDFNAGAFFHEMGITNPRHPGPEFMNGRPLPSGTDFVADPEVGEEDLLLVNEFVRFLAPLARRVPSDPDARAGVERGEELFSSVGCSSCHVPFLETGSHAVEAMSRKVVAFYSDFLLHDLGPEMKGVCGPDASPTEFRTGILMGVGLRDLYLHHGEATSLEEAVKRHGGEAEGARKAFERLSELDRYYVIQFLKTL